MGILLTSTAFNHNEAIPTVYTAEGKDISYELSWSNIPDTAKSLVLIVDDPDAPDPANPKTTWVHWVLYNLPATDSSLKENIQSIDLPQGALEGKNDWGNTGYGGPCPPIGMHRYFNKLYALDIILPDLHTPTKADLLAVMENHIIDKAELIGMYQKLK